MNQLTFHKIVQTSITGAITALVSLPFQHPFDALKTNMQSQQLRFLPAFQYMKQLKGWKAFYNGFSMNCIRVLTKQGFRWPLWITWSGIFTQHLSESSLLVRESMTGLAISFSQLILMCPFQRLKTWLMTTKTQQQTTLRNYFRIHSTLKDLYAGFWAMMMRQGLSWASFLSSSSYFKQEWRKWNNYDEHYALNFFDLMVVSVPTAFVNTAFIMPMDCIKTFYQEYENHKPQKSVLEIVRLKTNNRMSGLYIGWEARIIQYMIQSSFTLTAYEGVSHGYILNIKKKMRENKS